MGSNKGQTRTETTSSVSADPSASAFYRQLLDRVQGVAQTPYQAYTGELVAPLTAAQNQGVGQVVNSANWGQPYFQQAAGIAQNAAQPISAADIQRYASPHTQNVVDATQAQFDRSNAVQQAQAKGNAISRGALGGNRRGIEIGQIAQAQSAAQAPVIAGLYDKGYQQAVQTAAGQQAAQLQSAYGLSGIASAGQQAGIAGGNAMIGAGGVQQGYQQALDTANYGQYMQAQGYPYQQLQWAAGLGTGIGGAMGSTTTGQSVGTPAQPNPWTQAAGLGLSAASLFLSDERAKRDIERIGILKDGQPIYRYRYKGSDQWHMGPLAQEVEERHPEAVQEGVGGLKFVDMKEATDEAAARAAGGGVMPWSEGKGWIPEVGISARAPQSTSAPSLPGQSQDNSTNKMVEQAMGLARGYVDSNRTMGSPGVAAAMPVIGGAGDYAVPTFMATGGGVGGGMLLEDRFAPVQAAIADGTFDPQANNYTEFKERPAPMPRPRPEEAPQTMLAEGDDMALPPASAPASGVASAGMGYVPEGDAGGDIPVQGGEDRGTNFLGMEKLSGNAKNALLTAGLAMMSSKSPFFGVGVGEGGLAGVGAYNSGEQLAQKNARADAEARQSAQKMAQDLALRREQLAETKRSNQASEARGYQPKWGIIGTDPLTGSEQYGWIDPNTKTTTPGRPAQGGDGTSSPAAPDPTATGDDYLKSLPPDMQRVIKGVAAYRISPTTFSVNNGARERILRMAAQYNPGYDQTQFNARNGIVRNFDAGPESRSVRALGVAIDHLNTLQVAADALKTGDIKILNTVRDKWLRQTGSELPTNFDALRMIVSAEVAKAVVGGVTGVGERSEYAHNISSSNSPQQLSGVVQQVKRLMAGQLKGFKTQYERTGLNDFDTRFVSPSVREELEAAHKSEEAERDALKAARDSKSGKTGAAAPPPPDKREAGKTYPNAHGEKMKWNGDGWDGTYSGQKIRSGGKDYVWSGSAWDLAK